MSWKKISLLLVIFLLLLSVLKTPVALVAEYIPLPKQLAYQGLNGTLWQGSASRMQFQQWTFNNVTWELNPWHLFTAKATFDLKFGNARQSSELSGKGRVMLGLSGIEVEKATVRMPASPLKSFSPVPLNDLGGRVILDVTQFVQGDNMCDLLNGELTWTQSSIDFAGLIELGAISSNLSCEEQQLLMAFDGNNSLGLEGQARIASTKKYNFDGYLKPDPNLPKEIHDGLSMFSKMDSKGKFPVKL